MSSDPQRQFIASADGTTRVEEPPPVGAPQGRSPRPPSRRRIATIAGTLFAVTCMSTFFAGFFPGDLDGTLGVLIPLAQFWYETGQWFAIPSQLIRSGLVFAGCLMGILLAHEMGHYLLAKWHKIRATPPFFIPMPIGPFGTMGAVIFQDARRADRRQMFDIAIAGPLAGLVVALPVLIYGVATSEVAAMRANGEFSYGDPLLVQWIVSGIHGAYGPNEHIIRNPAMFAGWVGIFITALNLLPVGQLDGGHILYTLIRRKAHAVAMAVILGGVGWMAFTRRMDYALIVMLLLFIGPLHPQTADDEVPLGPVRQVLGWLTLAFIVIGFTPTPIVV